MPEDVDDIFGSLFPDREAPATKGDVLEAKRLVRELEKRFNEQIAQRRRWSGYNQRAAEAALGLAANATVLLWGGGVYALMRSDDYSEFWSWVGAVIAVGLAWSTTRDVTPKKPEN